jgi:hypothetical protein
MDDLRRGLDDNGSSRERGPTVRTWKTSVSPTLPLLYRNHSRRYNHEVDSAAIRSAPSRWISRSYGQAAATHGGAETSNRDRDREDRLRGRDGHPAKRGTTTVDEEGHLRGSASVTTALDRVATTRLR